MSPLIEFNDPFLRPLHMLVLELAVALCTALVLTHAVASYRRGERRHLFLWLVIGFYGLFIEIISYQLLDNFAHATFTVMLWGGKLPLYVVGLYSCFMYTGAVLVARFELPLWAEALLGGFVICLLDVPFDITGAALGWWQWFDNDPNIAHRWLGVPVTSYYWYMVFGAWAIVEVRLLWAWMESRLRSREQSRSAGLMVLAAVLGGAGVVVGGVLAFLPFHGLHALGASHGQLVAAHMLGCAALAVVVRGPSSIPAPRLAGAALILPGTMLLVLAWAALGDALEWPGEQLGWSLAAYAGVIACLSFLPLRQRSAVPATEAGGDASGSPDGEASP